VEERNYDEIQDHAQSRPSSEIRLKPQTAMRPGPVENVVQLGVNLICVAYTAWLISSSHVEQSMTGSTQLPMRAMAIARAAALMQRPKITLRLCEACHWEIPQAKLALLVYICQLQIRLVIPSVASLSLATPSIP
jgi:hypothetical protein